MTQATIVNPPAKQEAAPAAAAAQTIVLDFGARSKGKIKKLRKGQGPLMERVNETVAEFVREGAIPASSPVVIVVVKQRRKSKGIFG
jgi:hypothetical protein